MFFIFAIDKTSVVAKETKKNRYIFPRKHMFTGKLYDTNNIDLSNNTHIQYESE